MEAQQWIPANEFCASHNIEISFIRSLQETGLVEITIIEDAGFIPASQLQQLEKIIRLHFDLDINLEGIETVTHLLEHIKSLQDEVISLKNKLRRYE